MLQDIATERGVLAGLFQYGNEAYADTSDILTEDCFTLNENKVIFKCLQKTIQQVEKVDISTLLSTANDLGVIKAISEKSEMEYLRALSNFPVHLENVRSQAKKLLKLSVTRQLQRKMDDAKRKLEMSITGNESMDQIISIAEEPASSLMKYLTDGGETKPQLLGANIDEYIEFLRSNPNRNLGIPSPFPKWNEAIGGGFRRKTVSLVGARSGQGKSIFADNVAIHVASRLQTPVLMLDTEMDANDHQDRILAYFSKLPINFLATGQFAGNPISEEKIYKAASKIKGMPYTYKNVSGKPFEEILSIARRWITKTVGVTDGRTNDCLIIYDYMKLMDTGDLKNMAEFQALGFQISNLHNFCVQYDCPVLSFVQLNRDGIDEETQAAISQSDRLVWLCTNVSIFKSKTDEEIAQDGDENGNKKLIPVKARHGAGLPDKDYINMFMNGQYAQIEELRTRKEVWKQNQETPDDDDDE